MLKKVNVNVSPSDELLILAPLFSGVPVLFAKGSTDVIGKAIAHSLDYDVEDNPAESFGCCDYIMYTLEQDNLDIISTSYKELAAIGTDTSDGEEEVTPILPEYFPVADASNLPSFSLYDYSRLFVDMMEADTGESEAEDSESFLSKVYAKYMEYRESGRYTSDFLKLASAMSEHVSASMQDSAANSFRVKVSVLDVILAASFLQELTYDYTTDDVAYLVGNIKTALQLAKSNSGSIFDDTAPMIPDVLKNVFPLTWNLSLDYLLSNPNPESTKWVRLLKKYFMKAERDEQVSAVKAMSESSDLKLTKLAKVFRNSVIASEIKKHPYMLAEILGDPNYPKESEAVVKLMANQWNLLGVLMAPAASNLRWYICYTRNVDGFIVKRMRGKVVKDSEHVNLREKGIPIIGTNDNADAWDDEILFDFYRGNTSVLAFQDKSIALFTPLLNEVIWSDGRYVERVPFDEYRRLGLVVLKDFTNAPAISLYTNPKLETIASYLDALIAIAVSFGKSVADLFGKDMAELFPVMRRPLKLRRKSTALLEEGQIGEGVQHPVNQQQPQHGELVNRRKLEPITDEAPDIMGGVELTDDVSETTPEPAQVNANANVASNNDEDEGFDAWEELTELD